MSSENKSVDDTYFGYKNYEEWAIATQYEEYIKGLDEQLEKEHPEEYHRPVPNFIEKFAEDIKKLHPLIHYDVAYACASVAFSSCLPFVRFESPIALTPLNEMSLIIGGSGFTKTIPMDVTKRFVERTDTLLAESWTVEGLRTLFAEREDKKDIYSSFVHPGYGTMVIDEISQQIQDAETKSYLSGTIEEMSSLHDLRLKSQQLVSQLRRPQHPVYVCIVGATVNSSLRYFTDYFFVQGTAARFNWCVAELMEPEEASIEMNKHITSKVKHSVITKEIEKKYDAMEKLFDVNNSCYDEINKSLAPQDRNRKYIVIQPEVKEVDFLWKSFWDSCYKIAYDGYKNRPFGIDYQYTMRLAEMAYKQAGRNCIARNIDNIVADKSFDNIRLGIRDMQLAIARCESTRKTIDKLISYRTAQAIHKAGEMQQVKEIYTPKNLYNCLAEAPNQMLNQSQLQKASKISDPATFRKVLDKTIKVKMIIMVDKNSIIDKAERERLKTDTAAKIYTIPN